MTKNYSSAYYDQEKEIAEKTNAFLHMLTKRGLLKDQEISDKNVQSARQRYLQRAYHNTEMLLSKYRTLMWIMECYPEEIAQELDAPLSNLDALIEKIYIKSCLDDQKIENRLNSALKTRMLIDLVHDALTVLKRKPKNGRQLYRLIMLTYIQEEELSHTEILQQLDISSRTYYRLRREAIDIIATRLWATNNSNLDSWFEVLSLLEGASGQGK